MPHHQGSGLNSLCPLCQHSAPKKVNFTVLKREFLSCRQCDLLWVPHTHHISVEAERERYLHHHNSPTDSGYCSFLSRLFRPLLTLLPSGACGLDFGSGPNPTLSRMFLEAGIKVDIYDPLFGPHEVTRGEYDFITATEVVEHFREPRRELDQIYELLSYGGYLGIMTQEPPGDPVEREKWFYLRDPTHVSFFTDRCMQWWASYVGLSTVYREKGVWILQKV